LENKNVKAQKEAALQNLIEQMYQMMAEGKGDEPMAGGDVSEAMEEEGPMDEGTEMMDSLMGDDAAECDYEEEKSNFMKSKFDRPKRKSISVMSVKAKPEAKPDLLKTFMGKKEKTKGKK
jgi:hypothetical protein